MKSPSFLFLLGVFLPTSPLLAQYAVNDAATQVLLSKQDSDFLADMTTQFNKLDQQISTLNTVMNQGQQMLNIAGNPSAAISFAPGTSGLNPTAVSGSLPNITSIEQGASGARSLSNNGQGIFVTIPTTLDDGTTIQRNTDSYKKYDAFDQSNSDFQQAMAQAQTQRQQLLTQLSTAENTSATTQAEQSEKQARIEALSAQLYANDQIIRDAHEQRQAQAEANKQDQEKQEQADQEAKNTALQKAEQEDSAAAQNFIQQSSN